MGARANLPYFDFDQTLPPFAFRFPARMSVLPFGAGKLALVSPVPIDDAMARALAALGEVQYLIAPNLHHDRYLPVARARYPEAQLLAPARLGAKRPDLRVDAALDDGLPDALAAAVELVPIAGAPSTAEFVFFHRALRTLVCTDLVFNITSPRGLFAHLLLRLVGCHGRLAATRSWRFLVKDRAAAAASVERLLSLPFQTLVMAHGDVVRDDAHAKLAQALAWFRAAGAPRPQAQLSP